MLDFNNWLQQKTLNEVNRKEIMGYAEPSGPAITRRPKRGDMLITSPGTFLNKSTGRKVYRNNLVKPWMIISDQDPKNATVSAVRTGTGMTKQFNVSDIMYDVTDAYPDASDRLGAHHVWLFIAPDDTKRRQEYDNWFKKNQAKLQKQKEPNPQEQKDLNTQMRIAKIFGNDQDFQQQILNKHRRDNFAQQKVLGTAQVDAGDDPRYVAQVTQPKTTETPPTNDLFKRIALLRAQSAASKNGPEALRNYQNQQLRAAEAYRYY